VLLVVIDVDGDELDDVVVHEPARGEDGYRLLRSEGDRFSAATPLPGPAGTQSLHAARFQRDGSLRLVYAGAEQTAIATRNHDDYDALDPSIGHLLAVLDVDGDGRDDLLLAGPSQRELTLLVVTD
jgi:hypothetical protein